MSARLTLKFKPRRGNEFRASRQVSKNRSCSRSSILAPNSSGSGSPLPSSHAARYEGPKRNAPLAPDAALSKAVRLRRAARQTVLRPSAYVDLQPLGLTGGEEKFDSLFVFTLRPPSRIGPGMQVFQLASGSPDQAYPDPRCAYIGCRPVYGQSAFGLLIPIWRGIIEAPADVP